LALIRGRDLIGISPVVLGSSREFNQMRFNAKQMTRRACSGVALLLLGASAANAAVVPFSGVTGTYDQGGAYVIGGTIDGIIGGDNGWGVDGGQFSPQTAYFTASSPVSSPQLVFEMMQVFPSIHNVNEFRISVTQDASPNEGSAWTPLAITNADAHADMFRLADNRILARNNTIADVYQMRAASPFNGVTGVRLEVFPRDYNPADTLGASLGSATNGNFVLSEFVFRNNLDGVYENVALAKPVAQSTNGFGFNGTQGNDGIIYGGNITHTDSGDLAPFWEVDLEADKLIDNVEIFNRIGCCPERLYNFAVEVRNASDVVVYTSDVLNPVASGGTPTDPGAYFQVDLPGTGVTGRKVRIIKDANAANEWLSLGEVRVNVNDGLAPINILGDLNGDSLISVADFDILRNNFREGTTYAEGDLTFDGQIDLNDFNAFVAAYNTANPGSPIGVPEPSTWAMLGVGTLVLGWVRRRRNAG
jgi:hypothetical protein